MSFWKRNQRRTVTHDTETTPDLTGEPEEARTPHANELHMTAAHRNLVVDFDGTWAYYLLEDENWLYTTPGHRATVMRQQTFRWAELVGSRVKMYGATSPLNTKAAAATLDAEHPLPDPANVAPARSFRLPAIDGAWSFPDYLIDMQVRMKDYEARRSVVLLAVRITETKVKADELPHLLSPNPLGDSRGVLETYRQKLRQVTASVAGDSWQARPARPRVIAWFMHSALGLGAPVPSLLLDACADGWDGDDLPGFTNPVYATHNPYAASTTIRVVRNVTDHTSHVVMLHASKFGRRDLDNQGLEPWLSWLSNSAPCPTRWVLDFDVIPGEDLKEQADYWRRLGIDQDEHFRSHGEEPPTEVGRAIARSREVLDEVSTGDVAMAPRARGVVLVGVVGDTEDEAREHARKLMSAAAEKQQIILTHDYAQWESYRSLCPGEPVRRTGHVTRQPCYFVGPAVPNASPSFGDSSGMYVGPIAGGHDVFLFDPHGGTRRGGSGMFAIGGDQGAGKSTLMGAIAHHSAMLGMRTVLSDPAGHLFKLTQMPALKANARHLDLQHVRPGTLSPTLDPEPSRDAYATAEEFQAAVVAAKQERRSLLVETFRSLLPHEMIAYDTGGAVARAITGAVGRVGGDFGEDPWRYLAVMREHYGEAGRDVADALESRAEFRDGALVFQPKGQDVDPDYYRTLLDQAVLTVVTLKGVAHPPAGSLDRAAWTDEQRQAVPILNLAARFASRAMYLDRKPKVIGNDELGIQAAAESAHAAFLSRGSVETRRTNTLFLLLFQNPNMLLQIDDEIPNLIGAAAIGRMEEEVAARALRLLRLKEGFGYEQDIATLPKGGFLWRDWSGKHRQVQADQGWWHEQLLDALDTNPEGRHRTYDTSAGRDAIFEGAVA